MLHLAKIGSDSQGATSVTIYHSASSLILEPVGKGIQGAWDALIRNRVNRSTVTSWRRWQAAKCLAVCPSHRERFSLCSHRFRVLPGCPQLMTCLYKAHQCFVSLFIWELGM